MAAPCNRNVKRRPDLDAAGIAGTEHLIRKTFNLVQLSGEKGKEGIRFPAGAAVKLDLFYKLVCHVVHFLLDGNDAEHIDDEGNQDDSRQNVNKAADIRGIASLGQQQPFQFLFQ